jgi:23S rRNA pseudouridine1911/1915/1917 synthase
VPLARFVAERGAVPGEEARAAIERGGAFLSGRRVRDPQHALHGDEVVEVALRADPVPEALDPVRLLLADAHVLGVDKPWGVLSQEGKAGGPSLADLCKALLQSRGEPDTALLVHRLDRGTSGATVLARTKAAQRALLAEFREGRARKEYRALVSGEPGEEEGMIDLALGADPAVKGKRRIDPGGEPARTRYRVIERFRGAALVAIYPDTGRTHQIRVHLASLGLPLAGDARYGGPRFVAGPGGRIELARPMLHALSLRIAHPVSGTVAIEAGIPGDLLDALARLRVLQDPVD